MSDPIVDQLMGYIVVLLFGCVACFFLGGLTALVIVYFMPDKKGGAR